MSRFKLTIEFDGTPFVGWQRQENGPSVQQSLEEAAAALEGKKVIAHAAGRTDAGVHGLAMVAHINLDKELSTDAVMGALNHHLKPAPISILKVERVSSDFHARFSCYRRSYLYRILTRRAPAALDHKRVWRVPYDLDVDAMQAGADHLIGKHDFTTFRSTMCQTDSPVKTLETLSISRVGEEVHIHCAAPSFLHNQVRSFVGTLERVGAGKWQPRKVKEVLEACDRIACGPVAPARGLYFLRADYPD